MLTKRTIIGQIAILEFGELQVRQDTIIEEDGVELLRTFSRRVLEPDQDTRGETDARLTAVISAIWTDAVKTAYVERKRAQRGTPDRSPVVSPLPLPLVRGQNG